MLKAHPDTRPEFRHVMAPESVVVVGASPTHQWGRLVLENFARINYPGKVVAVNPKYDEIAGYPCYPSIGDVPFVPDSVMVSINRERAVGAIEEAAAKGIKGAVVIAIGFAEAGPEGLALQTRLTSVAREAGMSLIGPNCQGIVNFLQPSAQYMDTVHPYEPGRVALFAQSGSVTTAVTNNPRGVRWSHIVSCGNEAVSGAADLLGYFVDDPHTDIITGFIESIRRPEQFFHECDRAYELGKPVIILKSGKSEAGMNMAATHSGALAVPDRLVDELLKRHHVLRVDSMEELLETALALGGKRPKGNRFSIVTGSGGQIELSYDELSKYDIQTPAFTAETQETLRGILPSFLAPNNPLDWWGVSDYQTEYPNILRTVVSDPNIDVVIAVSDTTWGPTGDPGREQSSIDTISELNANTDKLVAILANIDGSVPAKIAEESAARGVLYLSGFPVGFKALERAVTFARAPGKARAAASPDPALAAAVRGLGGASTGGNPALEVLRAAGIPTVQSTDVGSVDEAVAAASAFGYPVVAKIGDVDSLHKSEVGGVILDIRDEAWRARGVRATARGGCEARAGPAAGAVGRRDDPGLDLGRAPGHVRARGARRDLDRSPRRRRPPSGGPPRGRGGGDAARATDVTAPRWRARRASRGSRGTHQGDRGARRRRPAPRRGAAIDRYQPAGGRPGRRDRRRRAHRPDQPVARTTRLRGCATGAMTRPLLPRRRT